MMRMIVSMVVLVVTYHQVEAWSGCPRPEDMLPCKCVRPRGYTNVTCEGNLSVLKDGLALMSKYWMGVDQINLVSDELKIVEERAFGMTDLHLLVLITPNLVALDPNCFRTVERNFNKLRILKSSIKNLEDVLVALKDIFSLYELVINHSNNLEMVRDDEFTDAFNNHNMRILDLSYNAIHTVGARAFDHLKVLFNLILKGNNIKSFHPMAIPSPNQLRIVDLSDNKINSLPLELIMRINGRQKLLLKNNLITTISLKDIRTSAERLVEVHLEGNQINCDASFKVLALMNQERRYHLIRGTCAEPQNLRGAAFEKLNATDFL